MPFTIDTVADALKSGTADLHAQTEALLIPKLSAIRSFADYAAILSMFYGYFQPMQQMATALITTDLLPDIQQRRHADLILDDLSALGVYETPEICDNLPLIDQTESAFGALYVLEGSTLGGRMISKMLQKNQDINLDEQHLQFFRGYGEHTGYMWTTFKDSLNKFGYSEMMIEAANATFLHLKYWIKHCLYATSDRKK